MFLKGKKKSYPFNSQGKKSHLNVRKAIAKSKEDLDYKCIAKRGCGIPQKEFLKHRWDH